MAVGLRSGEQYGPASYYALGATYPRDRLRKPYPRKVARFWPKAGEEGEVVTTVAADKFSRIYGPMNSLERMESSTSQFQQTAGASGRYE